MQNNQYGRPGSPAASSNKENQPLSPRVKIQNRRDSLGRGILKNYNSQDGNNTTSIIQIPLRDSQQDNSSALSGKKSYRRRVSFAPEVTLHKIDLIPHAAAQKRREPKRRETIAHFPPSSQDSNLSLTGDKETEFEAEEIEYDSSDVEMEDDSHVYSSPNKLKALSFQIHQDVGYQEDYTEPIEMSISRVVDGDDDECTMDLTKPLGEIQLPQNNSAIQTTDFQESNGSVGSQRPFGSIRSLFDEEEDEQEEEEVQMDLTQPFSVQERDLPRQQTISQTSDMSVDMTEGSSMELTSVVDGITDNITKKNTLLNTQLIRDDQDNDTQELTGHKTMDQTQVYGKVNNTGMIDQSMEVTESFNELAMDETHIFTSTQNDQLRNEQTITPVKSNGATPLKPTRSHTSEAGSPMSSKRKDITSSSNDLRERINSLTPRKRRKPSSIDLKKKSEEEQTVVPEISLPYSQRSSQDIVKSSFTPLKESNNKKKRASSLNSGRIDIGSFTEKAPLAPSHEETEIYDGSYEPRSLRKFLDDLSIEFFDDLNINDDFTVGIKPLHDSVNINDVDYTIAKSSRIPWLELYSFSCAELQKNMNELKRLFNNLDEEFAEENPQLVREYYATQSLAQQKKLGDMLLMMKMYSDKEAEKAWCSWHEKLLDELLVRLETNLDVLTKDHKLLAQATEKLASLEEKLNGELESSTRKLEAAAIEKDALQSNEFRELSDLKLELIHELRFLAEEEEQLEILEAEVQEIAAEAIDTTTIEMQVDEKAIYVERNSQEPSIRLNKLLESFDYLQTISGLRFISFESPNLHASLHDSSIKVTFDLINPANIKISLLESLPDLTRRVINKYLAENLEHDIAQVLKCVSHITQNMNKFDKDLFYISLVCPSVINSDCDVNVELVEFNKVQNYKARISFHITHDQLLSSIKLQEIKAKIIYGPPDLSSSTLLENFKRKFAGDHILSTVKTLTIIE